MSFREVGFISLSPNCFHGSHYNFILEYETQETALVILKIASFPESGMDHPVPASIGPRLSKRRLWVAWFGTGK